MQAPIPSGYSVRSPRVDDACAVAALIAACQVADGAPPETNTEEVLSDWQGLDLATEAVGVVAPDGSVVGSADVLNCRHVRVSVYGYAHPDHRGRGIGGYLVAWGEDWVRDHMHLAPRDARVVVEQYIRSSNASARALMDRRGYSPARGIYWMSIEMDEPPPAPEWPQGIAVRTFLPGRDERAVFKAGEESFSDTWSRPPSTLDRWMAPTRAEGFDPTLWLLAEDEGQGEVVGLCLCQSTSGRGNVATLGVRRQWRGRGVGLALLRHALGEFYGRGVREMGLSVDSESPTGAPRLYTRAGMRVVKDYVLYRKELRSGEELGRV